MIRNLIRYAFSVPYCLLDKGSFIKISTHPQTSQLNIKMDSTISWRKQFVNNELGNNTAGVSNNSTISMSGNSVKSTPIGIQKRRKSSFSSLYSPYTRRRSFLSRSMIEAESLQCYKLPSYSYGSDSEEPIPSYSISLSESQGFLWNQDLFATSYQQAEAGVSNSLSMSDGTYLTENNDSNGVDVIDVILTADDYTSDVEIVTEVINVGNEGDDYYESSDSQSEEGDDYENDNHDFNSTLQNENNKPTSDTTVDTTVNSDTDENNEIFYTEL